MEQFDENRRTFLGQLGAALLGALVVGEAPELLGNNKKKPPTKKGKKGDKGDKGDKGKKGKPKKKKKPTKKKPLKRKHPRDDLDGLVMGLPARLDEQQ